MNYPTTTALLGTVLVMILAQPLFAQVLPLNRQTILKQHFRENVVPLSTPDQPIAPSVQRGYSRYTVQDWRRLIDSTWGVGLPTDQKLQIFDGFWNNVNMYYGGFPNLDVNWDSLKSVFRPEVVQGVSRGRFAGIMSNMALFLRDGHTLITDLGIDSVCFQGTGFRPRGVPILRLSGWCAWGMGATMTPLPDSTLLVIQVDPLQPLGLKAGDIVLGYDRVPWKLLMRQLLDAQLPVASLIHGLSMWGASPESWSHHLLTSAASNWHLFDSLDVVKYLTGDTVHLPTSKLDNTDWDMFGYAEQLPVKGVPTVDPFQGPQCTWGIVDGTNVGYIYIQDWQTASLVSSAVNELTRVRRTDGLILDMRVNRGGNGTLLSELGGLFNNDPWVWVSFATRTSTSDKMRFTITPAKASVPPKQLFYDRPIAVLTGPECGSIGDWGAFFMRSHPMARFFGKPTATAYVSGGYVEGYYANNLWYYGVAKGGVYSNYPGEGHLFHKGFEVDERVWFAKDDVVKGDDTIVKHALQWIAGLAYAHDVKASKDTLRRAGDSVTVTAKVENPGSHALVVSAIVTNSQGASVDSLALMNDGLHGDGAAGDSVWGAFIKTPAGDGTYRISVRTDDKTSGTFRRLPNAALFTVSLTGAKDPSGILPQQFSVEQNYPNPFNPSTTIRYGLPQRSHVSLAVYNTLGQQVAILQNGEQEAGYHEVGFDASAMPSGVYFYRLQAGSYTDTKKLLLVR